MSSRSVMHYDGEMSCIRSITDIPNESLANIIRHIPEIDDKLNLRLVNCYFNDAIFNSNSWRNIRRCALIAETESICSVRLELNGSSYNLRKLLKSIPVTLEIEVNSA